MKRILLCTFVGFSIGCGSQVLEPIGAEATAGGGGEATGGGGTSTSGMPAGGAGGTGSAGGTTTSTGAGGMAAPIDPVLVHVHEAGFEIHYDLESIPVPTGQVPFGPGLPAPAGEPIYAASIGHDLYVTYQEQVPSGAIARFVGFLDPEIGMSGAVDGVDLDLPPVGSSTQQPGPMRGDMWGSLWMVTVGITQGMTTPSNTLRWSPDGKISASEWVVYEASPAIIDWAVLPDGDRVIAATPVGLTALDVDREAGTLDESGTLATVMYRAFAQAGGALFGLTDACSTAIPCVGVGEIHRWGATQDPLASVPEAVVQLPVASAGPCSMAAHGDRIVVGACSSITPGGGERKLWVYDVDAFAPGSAPLFTVDPTDEPFELVIHTWGPPTPDTRTLSIFLRGTDVEGIVYEDPMGPLVPVSKFGPMAAASEATDLLIAR